MNNRPARLDRDAVLDAMQDQIDDLTAVVAAQHKQLTRQRRLIAKLTTHTARSGDRTRRR
jgi:uncharacterized coiled-coil protein SlyX